MKQIPTTRRTYWHGPGDGWQWLGLNRLESGCFKPTWVAGAGYESPEATTRWGPHRARETTVKQRKGSLRRIVGKPR